MVLFQESQREFQWDPSNLLELIPAKKLKDLYMGKSKEYKLPIKPIVTIQEEITEADNFLKIPCRLLGN